MMQEHTVPAASNGAARRHRVEGGRPRAVKIRFTDPEYDAIVARAAEARVSVQRYLVERALSRVAPAHRAAPSALTAELAAIRRLTANLANNMNQIAHWLNAGGDPDARIPAAADAVIRVTRRLDALLAWLDSPQLRNGNPPRRPAQKDHRNERTANPQRTTRPAMQRPPGRPSAERHEQRHP
jgi:hypothetical protein